MVPAVGKMERPGDLQDERKADGHQRGDTADHYRVHEKLREEIHGPGKSVRPGVARHSAA
jgi:hypothetical protein